MQSPQVNQSKQQEKALSDTLYQCRETTEIRAVLSLLALWQANAMKNFSQAHNHDELLKAQAEFNYLSKLVKTITNPSPIRDRAE